MKGISNYPVNLNAFKAIPPFVYVFKQPKRRIRTAAQSCTFSIDPNAEKGPNF